MTALFAALVDDAGLFPPEELSMPDALARYRRDRASAPTVLTGRFLCPAAALPTLIASLADDDHILVGLIVGLGPQIVAEAVATVEAEPRLTLASVEGVPASTVEDAVATLAAMTVPRYVELPTPPSADALDALAAAGVGAKVRCGGLRAELFPTAEHLAAFLVECVRRGVPMKATAGLHHAVRHRDAATGFTHHGFLNLLLGVGRAVGGADLASVVEVLLSDDAAALADEAAHISPEHARATRAALVCYGSCSTSEPTTDLEALGLLGANNGAVSERVGAAASGPERSGGKTSPLAPHERVNDGTLR